MGYIINRYVRNLIVWLLAAIVLSIGIIIGIEGDRAINPHVTCFEDEVVAWDGDRHTVCVNLDEIDEYYHITFGVHDE